MTNGHETRRYPLSQAQQGMLFHSLAEPESGVYVGQVICELASDTDLYAFQKAWQSVVEQHEILRTHFDWESLGEAIQVVHSDILVELDVHDWRHVEADRRQRELDSYLTLDRIRGFDFASAPLMRFTLLRLPGDAHLFIWTHHHALMDGRGRAIVLKEVSRFYDAYNCGESLELAPAPSCQDYLEWFNAQTHSESETYWRGILGSFMTPVPLNLPMDSRPPGCDERYGKTRVSLSPALKTTLKSFARANKATANLVVQGAWALLLSRYSGLDDIVFGETRACRRSGFKAAGSLVGVLMNTVPIRLRAGSERAFSDLLDDLRAQHIELRTHENTPLVVLMKWSGLASQEELFKSIVVFEESDLAAVLQREGCELWRNGVRRFVPTHYPLTVVGYDKPQLSLEITYDRLVAGDAAAERIAAHLQRVLDWVVTNPGRRLGDLSLVTEDERRQLLVEWNATAARYPDRQAVHQVFEEQVARTPDAVAVVFDDASLSYGDLNARANRLANYLRRAGVKPTDAVAICAERGLEIVAAIVGVLKAGAVYVPIDPVFPVERKKFMLADSAAVALLAEENIEFPEVPGIARISVSKVVSAKGTDGNPDVAVDSEMLAYIMYTSGSTGLPKGVMVPHRAINRLVMNNGYAKFEAGDQVAFASNPVFDASTMELWGALLNGGRLVVIDQRTLLDPQILAQALKQQMLSVLWLTVGLFNQSAEALAQELSDLRYLIVGGDALDPRAIARALNGKPPQHLLNGYGPTETTTFAITHEIKVVTEHARSIPIGRPMANAQAYILDLEGQPVPAGVAGELYLAGAGVARGYLNRPELTAERFVANPFDDRPGTRMYRTGDLARWREDGTVDFLGRNDGQVKIRGFRIELGEIEARLMEHPGVSLAAVIAREDTPGAKRLVAYYVARQKEDQQAGHPGEAERREEDAGAEELRAFLAARLPEYMVPAGYVRLEVLPLSTSGKLDRKALPAPRVDAYGAQGYEAPAGELENMLAGIWAEVLQVEQVGRGDNFFALGGHSLLAMRMVSRVRQATGAKVAINDVFAHAGLSDFARHLEGATRTRQLPIRRAERGPILPLSPAQQRLWFLAQMEGASEAYSVHYGWRLQGKLDSAALRRALDQAIARHESLRTTFIVIDGEAVQRIGTAEDNRFQLTEHDLRKSGDSPGELESLVMEEGRAVFDLRSGPLIRGRLIQLMDDEHILLITVHHIVFDGWSMGVLLKELNVLYSACLNAEESPLTELAVQYGDYTLWQRQWLEGGDLAQEQARYWKETLAGASGLLELPTDRPRPVEQNYAGASISVEFDESLVAGLKELARRHGATLYMALLGGWAALFGRLSGQEEVVIGTPVANRGRLEIEDLIGFFVNLLAIRVKVPGSMTVGELLDWVKAQVLAAQLHQDIPFEQVAELAEPVRSRSHSPIFQVIFAWQNTAEERLELPGVKAQPLPMARETAKFDLTLSLQETDKKVTGWVEYATSLFEAGTVERHMEYFRRLLEAMVADESQQLDRIVLIGEAERHHILYGLNDTNLDYPQETCIHELFEQQVERTPGAAAVVHENQSLSYSDLNAEANRLAHYLIGLGVRPEDPVAICVERTPAMVIGMLAILKAGGAYVGLDPNYPSERLGQILTDAAPAILLKDAVGRAALGSEPLRGLTALDLCEPGSAQAQKSAWAEMPATNPNERARGINSRNVAYAIYTSGSTGKPKGVLIEHVNVANLLTWARKAFTPAETKHTLFSTSIQFDVSVFECFMPLTTGSTLHLVDDVLSLMHPQPVSLVCAVPSAINSLLDQGVSLSWISTINLGGEPVTKALMEKLLAQGGSQRLCNLYGPTETTTYSTWVTIPRDRPVFESVGRPVANTRIYLLDGNFQPVPLGVTGELYIGGAGVSRGYLSRPVLTAERFLPDPFGGTPDARMYKTGDLARYQHDGNIEYLGRNDHQVKIRGFRIELGEIEARLAEHSLIRASAVVAQEDSSGERRLVAYFVTTTEEEVTTVLPQDDRDPAELAGILRAYLAARLPEYMVPAAFVRLAAMPLTPNGKLNRKALPAPGADAYAQRRYEAPQSEIERILVGLWQELLGVDRVGRHDHFFDLGGHSLVIVRLLARVWQVLGVEMPMGTLFARPTLAELGQWVAEAVAKREQAAPAITPVSRQAVLPLSFAQQRLWFLAQLDDVSAIYHVPIALHLHGPLDSAVLRRSLDALFARHEALRSVFVAVDGEPRVELLPEQNGVPLVEDDLRGIPEATERLAQLLKEEANAPFYLVQGPLIRARLIRLEEQKYIFLLTQHHIITDGWSLGILARELSALYRAFIKLQPNPLPAMKIQYPDYAAWQRQWLSGNILKQQGDYWRKALAGAPVLLELPADRPRPAQQSFAGGYVLIRLDAELTRGLRQLSGRHGTTLFMTLLGAWAVVLSRLSGQNDVVIGVPTANRGRPATEELIGFFVNTLALRIDFGSEPRVPELLAQVRATALAAQDHQDLPFEQVVEIVQPPRRLSHTPLFQVMFAWQNNEEGVPDFPGVAAELESSAYGVARFDLKLDLREQGDIIVGGLNYATALFDEATIHRHREYLLAVLKAMVADQGQAVTEINLSGPEERRLLLKTWNDTESPYRTQVCIHQLFEEQVSRTPDARAVICEDQAFSYAELNAQANRLAHFLIGLGVKPDDRIAICVERSVGMVTGLLGILKASAAYLPLDPAYPTERLKQLLTDAAPEIVLVDEVGRKALGTEALKALTVLELDKTGCVKGERSVWAELPPTDPDARTLKLTAHHLAYVIYTSGSTGTPKGVMNEHQALINRLTWMQAAFGLECGDVVLQKTSFSFDVSVWEFFWTLLQGATLAMVPPEAHKDSLKLIELIRKWKVTTIHFVPSMLGAFVNSEGVEGCTTLRRLISSGEALPPAFVHAFQDKLPASRLYNLYGPTEAAIDVTAWSCPASFSSSIVPIGKPIANTQIYLLDGKGHPALLGTAGELYIGGVGVARGYLKRPELTAERFVPDPFSSEPGARLYKTGDLARYLPDANIEFLGRNDHQVKIRGFRIELGEIETCLAKYPAVREAVVLAREDAAGEKRLVAYVTLAAPEEVIDDSVQRAETEMTELASTLRAYLAARLPEYMAPAAFVRLEELPLTPNGKLDRKSLPAPEGEAYARRRYEPPQGEAEEALAGIWQELLGIERVGRHDHFFELGGHSLLAIKLLERLRRLDLQTRITTLFTTPVLSDLAAALCRRHEAPIPAASIQPDSTAITPEMLPLIDLTQADIDWIIERVPGGIANIQDIYALSPLQEGLLFHHLLATDGDPYVLSSTLAFPDRTLLDRFLAAVQQVIDRHDILRTAFLWIGMSKPAQVVWRKAQLPVTEVDLNAQAGSLEERLGQHFDPRRYPIELTQAPLQRFVIAREPGTARWLVLHLQHHLIEDVRSIQIVTGEIKTILRGQGHTLAPPTPFRNFVAQARFGITHQEHERFFRQMLAEITEPTLPFGLANVRQNGADVTESRRILPQPLNDRLRAQARRLGVGLASLCHLAWGQVLARSSGCERVVFGTVLFGRMQAAGDADLAVGLLINTLPLRLDLDDTGTESAVRQAHARLAELLVHEHASLSLAQRCSGVAAPIPLFSAVLNYRHQVRTATVGDELESIQPLTGSVLFRSEERTNYPLTLSIEDFEHGLGLTALVVRSLPSERVCGYMHQALENLVLALETDPDMPVRELDIVPPEERRLLLKTWNATEAPYPEYLCLHQWFEQQVRKTPQAMAVAHGEQSLSYAELNVKANCLAHYLIALGVKPDDRVAICVERSPGMIVGLLAILKAGGAYVPLDPSYPRRRLVQILKDAAPRILLSDGAGHDAPAQDEALRDLKVIHLEKSGKATGGLPAWESMLAENPDAKNLGITSANLAYVIFTSGSTGIPKGVMLTHQSALCFTSWAGNTFSAEEFSAVLATTSICFDLSIFEMWATLSLGGTVILAENIVQWSENRTEAAGQLAATLVNTVPSAMEKLLERGLPAGLSTINLAGEAIPEALVKKIFAAPTIKFLNNLYGPTETTVYSTWAKIIAEGPVTIGRPIDNTHVYVLDSAGKLAPMGVAGELYISGAGLARGYWRQPDRSAERFLPNPYSEVPGERVFRTGDLVRWQADGQLVYLGRIDHQVKIRGFRIELGEIETRLAECPGVREAVVAAREDASGEKHLVAWCTCIAGHEPQVAEVRSYLQKILPQYMVPAAFVFLAEMPRTPNGKLDRKALPAPNVSEQLKHQYAAPRTPMEGTLCAIWEEVLRVPRAGMDDNFFELGGNSLIMVLVRDKIQQKLQREFPIAAMFEHSTVSSLARYLADNNAGAQSFDKIGRRDVEQRERRRRLREQREQRELRRRAEERLMEPPPEV